MQVSVESARGDANESSAAIDRAGATKMPRVCTYTDVGNNRQFSVGPSMRRGMKPHGSAGRSDKGKNARTRAIVNRANRAFETPIRDAAIGNRSESIARETCPRTTGDVSPLERKKKPRLRTQRQTVESVEDGFCKNDR